MSEQLIIYRIKHKDLGLYSKGGSGVDDRTSWGSKPEKPKYACWSKLGKVWLTTGPLKNHLSQYVRRGAYLDANGNIVNYNTPGAMYTRDYIRNNIPDTWIIQEHNVDERTSKEYPARSLYPETGPISPKK